jgi:hypothetical protein
MGLDQTAVEKYLRDLAQPDGDEEDVEALLDGLQTVHAKFSAIGKFADTVLARLAIAGNATVAKEQTAERGRTMNATLTGQPGQLEQASFRDDAELAQVPAHGAAIVRDESDRRLPATARVALMILVR